MRQRRKLGGWGKRFPLFFILCFVSLAVLFLPTHTLAEEKNTTNKVSFDAQAVLNALGEEYVIIFKFHPLLLKTTLSDDSRVINMNHENTHDLFAVCDVLISDFSSIIFDYSLLNKPMCFFVPDLDEYIETLGCFVDYRRVMPGAICYNETQVIAALQGNKKYDIKAFRDMFFKYQDGHNTQRIVMFIDKLINTKN